MNNFQKLVEFKKDSAFTYNNTNAKIVFVPDLGARVFCEFNNESLHRLDIENVYTPNKPFNNYGGNNFWPAPEGGMFGFNYDGDRWLVQPAINNEPFMLKSISKSSAVAEKITTLQNRKGTRMKVKMQRVLAIDNAAAIVSNENIKNTFACTVEDKIDILDETKIVDGLLACWTLEQFNASDETFSFVKVKDPEKAINFDFYEHPGERITYKKAGFVYKTDGQKTGQIGIKVSANAEFVGFYDLSKNLLCIREIVEESTGTYFNIADNAQPNGPYSAADNYSIYNGNKEQGFFEIETIGAAKINSGILKGSTLKSRTTFAQFNNCEDLKLFISKILE
ncbi:MAG: hypothetical protein A2Y12_06265 [Planctomycetes bacterium GWF2_42_9]|nr:MAG: hypothetical protein A2Y12_06265 [Planctomycetes bacterium GWF2_42_9]